MAKRSISVKLHPNTKTKFNTNEGWRVHNEHAGLEIDYHDKAICIAFGKEAIIEVWNRKPNGDLTTKIYEQKVQINRCSNKKARKVCKNG